MTLEHLPGFTLEPPHPFAGREAYQCSECGGISYAISGECPYCNDEEKTCTDSK